MIPMIHNKKIPIMVMNSTMQARAIVTRKSYCIHGIQVTERLSCSLYLLLASTRPVCSCILYRKRYKASSANIFMNE